MTKSQPIYLTEKPKLSPIGIFHLELLNEMFAPELKAIRAKAAKNG